MLKNLGTVCLKQVLKIQSQMHKFSVCGLGLGPVGARPAPISAPTPPSPQPGGAGWPGGGAGGVRVRQVGGGQVASFSGGGSLGRD